MKKMFKKTLATVVAVATMAVGMGGMSASAENVSGSAPCDPIGTIYGNINLSWYSPIDGVNVYTVKATTSVSGVTGYYTLYTGLDVRTYPFDPPRQDYFDGDSSVSLSGSYSYGQQKRAYSSHKVRGSSTGVLYLEFDIIKE